MTGPLPNKTLAETRQWGGYLGEMWALSRPDVVLVDNPRWLDDLKGWLDSAHDSDVARVDKVMRRLRRAAPREYDVLSRTLLLGEGFEEVTEWLNARALRNDIPLPAGKARHYEVKDAVALFAAGIAFVRAYW